MPDELEKLVDAVIEDVKKPDFVERLKKDVAEELKKLAADKPESSKEATSASSPEGSGGGT